MSEQIVQGKNFALNQDEDGTYSGFVGFLRFAGLRNVEQAWQHIATRLDDDTILASEGQAALEVSELQVQVLQGEIGKLHKDLIGIYDRCYRMEIESVKRLARLSLEASPGGAEVLTQYLAKQRNDPNRRKLAPEPEPTPLRAS